MVRVAPFFLTHGVVYHQYSHKLQPYNTIECHW